MKATFTSRWGLILAALGMAVGTGNVWRFPRILAQNGGGTFLIPWALFLFTWSIPLLMVEFGLGRSSQRGPVGAFTRIFGPGRAWRGGFVAFCTMAIMFYYSVVSGWTVRYLGLAISGGFAAITPENAESVFVGFTDTAGPAFTHLLSIGIACTVVGIGVVRGIERACKIFVPTLFVVLAISAARGLSLDGSDEGLAFLTTIDWNRLFTDHRVWLEALSQSAWSTGAGWGLMLCYAIYASSNMRAGRECVTTGIGNNFASLLAALAIIPAVFALAPLAGADPDTIVGESGPASTGLTFVWIPVLFQQMETGGTLLGILFFLGLAFAALSSLIALVELTVRTLADLGLSRKAAVISAFVGGYVLGLPSAVDFGFIPGHDGLSVFGNQDWVWGLGLIVSGSFAGFSVLQYGVRRFHEEHITGPEGRRGGGALFRLALTVLVPIQALALLGWWFWRIWDGIAKTDESGAPRSFTDRLGEWLDPTEIYSIGTCLVQWGIVIAVLVLFNRKLAGRVGEDGSVA